MSANTPPTGDPNGTDLVLFHCPVCHAVTHIVAGPVTGDTGLTIYTNDPNPCPACRAKGH